jgi:hypothetical protein
VYHVSVSNFTSLVPTVHSWKPSSWKLNKTFVWYHCCYFTFYKNNALTEAAYCCKVYCDTSLQNQKLGGVPNWQVCKSGLFLLINVGNWNVLSRGFLQYHNSHIRFWKSVAWFKCEGHLHIFYVKSLICFYCINCVN